uniref:TSA: Wollemia nobilis Ref_Wollemi_Transcript_12688_1800 transcribed RNA sequence n=1 Tax=Wollemia nobilis TaxID=56998 RepID=A0A0C9RUC3_9CONI
MMEAASKPVKGNAKRREDGSSSKKNKNKGQKVEREDTPSKSTKKGSKVEVDKKDDDKDDSGDEDEDEDEDDDEGDDDDVDVPGVIDVPDADFYDFDKERTRDCFQQEQIWAAYDDDDGMPRFYARILKVVSSSSDEEFKVKMNWLEALRKDKAVCEWLDAGFYQGSGDFKAGKAVTSDALNIFSHVVAWEKSSKGIIRIIPRKDEVWALYREWSSAWDNLTPPEVRHKYEMVVISNDFDEEVGLEVTYLVKVDGFKSVFQRTHEVKWIPRSELLRFSHQVPAKKLLGEEAPNLPDNCWELDPAATSTETR